MSFITPNDLEFTRRAFRFYYAHPLVKITVPTNIAQREFGYFTFGEKVMVRHFSLKNAEDLSRFLDNNVPLHIYYSSAFFRSPTAPMEDKGWIGADLFFDIDADHLPVGCKKEHDFWVCSNCGASSNMPAPNTCPNCGEGVTEVDWICDHCLKAARTELLKLLEFLQIDFGISSEHLTVNFSGHRGFHLLSSDESFRTLDSTARREIVDYVTGQGLTTDRWKQPEYSDVGWPGRIARSVLEILQKLEDPFFADALKEKLGTRRYADLVKRQSSIVDAWLSHPRWDLLTPKVREILYQVASREQAARVDTVVTTDVHRLVRLSNTLHGKTGLLSRRMRLDQIEDFDPLGDTVALPSNPVDIRILHSPRFRLGDVEYGPYNKENVSLPMYVAAFLLCKGVATTETAEIGKKQ